MAEFEELALSIAIVDNASAQIDMLKRKVDDLGGAAKNLSALSKQTQDFSEQLKRLTDTVLKGPDAWLKYAAGMGATAGAIGAVGFAAEKLTAVLGNMAEKMV